VEQNGIPNFKFAYLIVIKPYIIRALKFVEYKVKILTVFIYCKCYFYFYGTNLIQIKNVPTQSFHSNNKSTRNL